eukprot:scaffold232188_cov19-Tisochrysis_lutea.AAC.1
MVQAGAQVLLPVRRSAYASSGCVSVDLCRQLHTCAAGHGAGGREEVCELGWVSADVRTHVLQIMV